MCSCGTAGNFSRCRLLRIETSKWVLVLPICMPAIASGVLKSGANFYWHPGDFRAIFDFDDDMAPRGPQECARHVH